MCLCIPVFEIFQFKIYKISTVQSRRIQKNLKFEALEGGFGWHTYIWDAIFRVIFDRISFYEKLEYTSDVLLSISDMKTYKKIE